MNICIKIYYVTNEFQDYKLIDEEISINEYPAITVCNDNIFEELFFHNTRGVIQFRRVYNVDNVPNFTSQNLYIRTFLSSYNNMDGIDRKFLNENFYIDNQDQFEIVMDQLENKNKSLHGTLDLLSFYGNHYLWETMDPNILVWKVITGIY